MAGVVLAEVIGVYKSIMYPRSWPMSYVPIKRERRRARMVNRSTVRTRAKRRRRRRKKKHALVFIHATKKQHKNVHNARSTPTFSEQETKTKKRKKSGRGMQQISHFVAIHVYMTKRARTHPLHTPKPPRLDFDVIHGTVVVPSRMKNRARHKHNAHRKKR